MVGMSQIKRRFYTGLGIGLGVAVVLTAGVSIFSYLKVKSYREGTNKYYIEHYTKEIAVTNQTIMQGQTVTDDMLTTTRVHINMVPDGAINSVGANQVAKYNIGSNMPITYDMIADEIIDEDLREVEVNTVLLPTNLVEGAYVDIRIQFPNGTDYIVLPELQVKKILNTTMWFDLNEEQRNLLASAEVDTYLNEGTKLYAIEYVDETQIVKAQENVEEIVKGQLISLIKSELPELYTADYSTIVSESVEEKIRNNANVSDTTEEQDWLEDEEETELPNGNTLTGVVSADRRAEYERAVSAEKASMIFNFINKYRNITAATTNTPATYQPTSIIIDAMKNNPIITTEAKAKLNSDVRNAIESLNNRATNLYGEDEEKIVEGAQESIDEQVALRNSLMAE